MSKPKKTFKEYYSDPQYRQRHLDYLMMKIPCPGCGIVTARSNMHKHRSTKKHFTTVQSRCKLTKLDTKQFKAAFNELLRCYRKINI